MCQPDAFEDKPYRFLKERGEKALGQQQQDPATAAAMRAALPRLTISS